MNDSDGLGDATAEGTTFRPGSCMSTAWSSSREAYGWGTWWNGLCMREKKLEALEEAAMAFIEENAPMHGDGGAWRGLTRGKRHQATVRGLHRAPL